MRVNVKHTHTHTPGGETAVTLDILHSQKCIAEAELDVHLDELADSECHKASDRYPARINVCHLPKMC